jgi:hypothetical protein
VDFVVLIISTLNLLETVKRAPESQGNASQ